MADIVVYTDGACQRNPGPGGWGVLIESPEGTRELSGGELETTNNRMELMAAIRALNALAPDSCVLLYTDSQYVQKGMTQWLERWLTSGRLDQGAVKNSDLWFELLHACAWHDVEWCWVRGHSGIEGNETADRLANEGIEAVLAEA